MAKLIKGLNWTIILVLSAMMLIGCASNKPKVTERIVYDTVINNVYKDRLVYDSIYIYDSVFNRLQNDTVYLEKYKTIYKYLYKYDTICQKDTIIKSNTITQVKEVKRNNGKFSFIRLLVVVSAFVLGAGVIYRYFKAK